MLICRLAPRVFETLAPEVWTSLVEGRSGRAGPPYTRRGHTSGAKASKTRGVSRHITITLEYRTLEHRKLEHRTLECRKLENKTVEH